VNVGGGINCTCEAGGGYLRYRGTEITGGTKRVFFLTICFADLAGAIAVGETALAFTNADGAGCLISDFATRTARLGTTALGGSLRALTS
jgi:hypothetical protein